MHSIPVSERRRRLVRRHHLAPETPAPDPASLAERLVGLHATDPATPFLSARARIDGFEAAELESALYESRALVKHLGMRRTLFVLPTSLVPVVQGACTSSIAKAERKRLARDVERGGIARDGARWLARAERAALRTIAELGSATGSQISKLVPALRAKLVYGEGKTWGGEIGVASRVYTIMAAEGRIVRGRPNGSWTSSQHRWSLTPAPPVALPEEEAQRELIARWLAAFGPATVADIVWWTGLGAGKVRAALARLGAQEVDLDGELGVVLPGDLEPEPPAAPAAAFLPALDPTTMGWKRREWYLGAHGLQLFDANGNAGPTVWWDGRIVGGWSQRASGEVVYELLEDVGGDAAAAIEREADRLQQWLGDVVVTTRFPTPLARRLRG